MHIINILILFFGLTGNTFGNKTTPMDVLIKKLEKHTPNHYDDARIAKIYLMAYATGEKNAPIEWDSPYPDFDEWLKQSNSNEFRLLPKVKMPISKERVAYLHKAIQLFQLMKNLTPLENLELAWCLFEDGKAGEARNLIKEDVVRIGKIQSFFAYSPYASFSNSLPKAAKTFLISVEGKPVFEQNIYARELHDYLIHLTLISKYYDGQNLDLTQEAIKFSENPSKDNFEKIIEKSKLVEKTVSSPMVGESDNELNNLELINYLKTRFDTIERSEELLNESLIKAVDARSISECHNLVGKVDFGGLYKNLDFVCVANLARKTGDRDHCLKAYTSSNDSDRYNLQICLNYLAFRQKSDLPCKIVGRVGFNERQCIEKSTGNDDQFFTGFYKHEDWNAKTLNVTAGKFLLDVKPVLDGKIEVTSVRFTDRIGGDNFASSDSKEDVYPPMKDLPKKTLSLSFKDKTGKQVGEVFTVKLTMLPNIDKNIPSTFSLDDFYKNSPSGEVMQLYMRTLDEKKDSAEIKALRESAWMETQLHKLFPGYQGVVYKGEHEDV